MYKIFKPAKEGEKGARMVLVEGKPGIGKTTFCLKIARDWAKKIVPVEFHFPAFKFLFLLKCCDIHKDTKDMVQAIDEQVLHDDMKNKKCFLNYIRDERNQNEILLIPDGLDELPEVSGKVVDRLFKRKVFSRCFTLVTSREEKGIDVQRRFDFDTLLQIKGFTSKDATDYIRKHFKSVDPQNLSEGERLIQAVEENIYLDALQNNPLNLLLLQVFFFVAGILGMEGTLFFKQIGTILREEWDWHNPYEDCAIVGGDLAPVQLTTLSLWNVQSFNRDNVNDFHRILESSETLTELVISNIENMSHNIADLLAESVSSSTSLRKVTLKLLDCRLLVKDLEKKPSWSLLVIYGRPSNTGMVALQKGVLRNRTLRSLELQVYGEIPEAWMTAVATILAANKSWKSLIIHPNVCGKIKHEESLLPYPILGDAPLEKSLTVNVCGEMSVDSFQALGGFFMKSSPSSGLHLSVRGKLGNDVVDCLVDYFLTNNSLSSHSIMNLCCGITSYRETALQRLVQGGPEHSISVHLNGVSRDRYLSGFDTLANLSPSSASFSADRKTATCGEVIALLSCASSTTFNLTVNNHAGMPGEWARGVAEGLANSRSLFTFTLTVNSQTYNIGMAMYFRPTASFPPQQRVRSYEDSTILSVASTSQESQENRTLKVTLLSNEWKSSTDGELSTINRELAIQLAKHPNVDVSVLLPSCSREDRSSAKSHNVKLIEAQRVPGVEPVLWLSSPPRNHTMDCVIGHGVHLGRLITRHPWNMNSFLFPELLHLKTNPLIKEVSLRVSTKYNK
ncbi:Baculoviral IAP repeat-containing protein 1 [Stylophora pistillata]|uniref:Baculoviral IAP repeat-containing protein 1 n=1 Tax=Stylophora pistillata TaxID=50429 RepID=A0A2B4RF44_STYPI|nr:Baculoviral IAP repeat-containing protein 1 [Stylophora pistillata]